MPDTPENRWHLDKRVPLALVITMLVQTGGAVWWAASIESRATTLERDIVRMRDENQRDFARLQSDQQRDRDDVRLQVNGLRLWMEGRFDRIEQKLDRKVDKP